MQDSRIKNTSRNIFYSFILQMVKILFVFINRIIFVRTLGAAYLGVNGLFTNILGILSLTDLGMTTALMYSLYKPLSQKDEKTIIKYMNYFDKIYIFIAIAVAIIGITIIPSLKYLVNLPNDMPNIYIYYILMLSNSVISYLCISKTTLLCADQRMYILNKYDTIFQFILFIMQVGVLLITNSFVLYLFSNTICTLISNIIKVRKTKQIYPFLNKKNEEGLSKKEKKSIFTNVFSLFFYKLGGIIQDNTDSILISIFVGTITVGYYSNYLTIISAIVTFITMVFSSIKASMGNYVALKDKHDQLKMFYILEVYNFWLISFCSICFLTLIPDFISICFGQEYVLDNNLLICAVLNFYTGNIRQTIWTYRETTGIFTKTKFITIITAIINVFASIVLGYYFGLVGIVGATVLSRMIYAWWKEPQILFKNYFETSPKQYYINYIKRIFLTFFVFRIVNIICNLITVENIYLLFILKMLICIFIPNIIYILIYRNNQAIIYLKKKFI